MSACVLVNYRRMGRPEFVIGVLTVVNTVVHGQLPFTFDTPCMWRMARGQIAGMDVRYEPDLFAGIVITPVGVKMKLKATSGSRASASMLVPLCVGVQSGGGEKGTTTVFKSGQFNIAGTTSLVALSAALDRLEQVITAARRDVTVVCA